MQPTDEKPMSKDVGHTLTLRRCQFRRGFLSHNKEAETLPLDQALRRLAPTGSRLAKLNVIRVRPGYYIGVMKDGTNFMFKNPTFDGNIGWILQKRPDFEEVVQAVYFVEDFFLKRDMMDLPGDPERK